MKRRPGFTLIEMLIVIVVIAILALLVIPRLLDAGRKAKEATLRGNLHQLRDAVQQFEADCDAYPANLKQLYEKPSEDATGGNGDLLDIKSWQGPYIRTYDGQADLPTSPFLVNHMTGEEEPGNAGDGWNYDPKSGEVHSASTLSPDPYAKTKYSDW